MNAEQLYTKRLFFGDGIIGSIFPSESLLFSKSSTKEMHSIIYELINQIYEISLILQHMFLSPSIFCILSCDQRNLLFPGRVFLQLLRTYPVPEASDSCLGQHNMFLDSEPSTSFASHHFAVSFPFPIQLGVNLVFECSWVFNFYFFLLFPFYELSIISMHLEQRSESF